MKTLLCILLFSLPLWAGETFTEFKSADGKKTLLAKPIDVDGDKILFQRATGGSFSAKPETFSASDREQLIAWKAALEADSHRRVVKRVQSINKLRVLFVGNSYSFKIPMEFKKLAQAEGKNLEVTQVTKGGWSLEKHASSKETLDQIAKGKWDLVVLQEQSLIPAFPEPQRSQQMDSPAKKLADAVRAADAIPVFFLTWGRKDGDKQNAGVFPGDTFTAMQARLDSGYKNASKHAGGAFIVPVGTVWSELRKQGEDQGLYADDGSHPAAAGNYLGACVFYSAFYDEVIKGRGSNVELAGLISSAAEKARLQPIPYGTEREVEADSGAE